MLEYTKGDKTLSVPGWVVAAIGIGVVVIATELCKK